MKKLKLLLASILCSTLIFATGCNNNKVHPSSGEPETVEPSEPQHEHVYGEWVETVSPTCTGEGKKERVCECGEKEEEVIPALGHLPGEWEITVEATKEHDGERVKKCQRCHEVLETESYEFQYTADVVAADFNAAIAEEGVAVSYYDLETFTGWYLGVYLAESTDDSEENLKSAAYVLAGFLPDYMELYKEEYTAATETSGAEYDMALVTESFESAVEIYGYIDDGYLAAEIYIYNIEL